MVDFRSSIKLLLFLSSYSPLSIIAAVKLWSTSPLALRILETPVGNFELGISWITVSLFLISVLLFALLYLLIWYHKGHKTTSVEVKHYEQRNELLSNYLLVYVFAFVGLNLTSTSGLAILLIFLSVLAIIQLQSEMLHVNPLLSLMGYQVYEVESDLTTVLVISNVGIKERLKTPASVSDEEDEYQLAVISMGHNSYLIAPEDD